MIFAGTSVFPGTVQIPMGTTITLELDLQMTRMMEMSFSLLWAGKTTSGGSVGPLWVTHTQKITDEQRWSRPHTLWGKAEGTVCIKELEAGRGRVGGEWVSVFIYLKGFPRDRVGLPLCGSKVGWDQQGYLQWDIPLVDTRQEEYKAQMICLTCNLWILRQGER